MNARKFLPLLLIALAPLLAQAKDGYKINLKLSNTQDTMVYLMHYYGKGLPTIYKRDSSRIDKNGNAVFQSKEAIVGGIYMALLSDRATYFEFLLDNGQEFTINADIKQLPDGLAFKGSKENEDFVSYIQYLKGYGAKQKDLTDDLAKAKTKDDTAAVRKRGSALGKELIDYRQNFANAHSGTLLTSIFNALNVPQVPEGDHRLPNGKIDSNFAYNYYKAHYWDGFNFKDDRLIHAPIYDAKLDEYFNKVLPFNVDTIEKYGDQLLAQTRGQKELFKYTLWWITRNAETSKIMGMDQVFVYFVEEYFMKGDAYWLTDAELQKYIERIQKIGPNILGKMAPEIMMQDMKGKPVKLSDVDAKWTLVIFWDPTCGHCTKEIPAIDSAYKASLKAKGVKVFAVKTEAPDSMWKDFVVKHKLEDWMHVHDPQHRSDYRSKYDVYSTPTIYLLDEKKIIRGKRLDHTNIGEVIDMTERRAKAASAGTKPAGG